MNSIIDIGIIIIILFGGILGFKRGFTYALIKAAGTIAIVVIAFLFKDIISNFLYENLPFLNFGLFKNIEVLNILFYEFLAFLILFIILKIVLHLVLMTSKLFEKILSATIILSIPSKFLGFFVGLIQYYIITFIILILTLNFIDINSTVANTIVKDTPVLSDLFTESVGVFEEFKTLKEQYSDKTISEYQFNVNAINLFLKYDIISIESVNRLIELEKINYDDYKEALEQYKGE